MTHRLTLSPRRARVLRWCERKVDADLVAVWGPEDKQTLAALVMDGLVMPTGSRYELTPDGVRALQAPIAIPKWNASLGGKFNDLPPGVRQSWAEGDWDLTPDFPPSSPEE